MMASGRLRFAPRPLDFAALPAFGAGSLMARVSPEFAARAGFPLLDPVREAAHVSASPWLDSAAAAGIIARWNPHLPPPPPGARYVVAGQQAGLLTGPLYTFLKAVSAISLSERLAARSGAPVLPLFWIASEDHDILEVNRVTVARREFVWPYEGELARGRAPQAADAPLGAAREPLLAFLRETLQPTEFTTWLLGLVEAADFSNYETAFRDLMRALFRETPLRLISPIALRPLTSPILAAAVERWQDVTEAFLRGSDVLKTHGFAPPLAAPGLFEITEGRRAPVEIERGRAKSSRGWTSLAELAAAIRERPGAFSPAAALRPVVQDAALPAVATLGGPAELLYLWQIHKIYEILNIKRSRVWPRVSATFIEAKIRKAAERAGFWPDRLFDIPRELDSPATAPAGISPEADALERHAASLLSELDALIPPENPPAWMRKARAGIASGLERFVANLREEALREAGQGRDRLEKIAAAILPGGKPQERVVNPFTFLNLYGPDFIRLAIETLDPEALAHLLVEITISRDHEEES